MDDADDDAGESVVEYSSAASVASLSFLPILEMEGDAIVPVLISATSVKPSTSSSEKSMESWLSKLEK